MNRRSFLQTTSLAAVGGLVATTLKGTTPPRKGTYTPVSPALFYSARDVHASTVGNLFRGNAVPQDFLNTASALNAMHTNWVAAGLDSLLIPAINTVSEDHLTVARMGTGVNWAVETINSTNPAVTVAQVTPNLNDMLNKSVVNGFDYKTQTLNKMRAGQTSLIIQDGINFFNNLANKIPAPKTNPTTHKLVPQVFTYPIPTGGGGGDDACDNIETLGLALGIAAVTLTVMTGGLDLLAAAGWAAVAAWADMSAVGLGIEHRLAC